MRKTVENKNLWEKEIHQNVFDADTLMIMIVTFKRRVIIVSKITIS